MPLIKPRADQSITGIFCSSHTFLKVGANPNISRLEKHI